MNPRRRLKEAVYISGAIFAVGVLAAAAFVVTRHRTRTPVQATPAVLEVHIDGDHVHVSWDPTDARLRPARSGVLTFVEGQRQRTIPLSTVELKSSKGITYVPSTDRVTVRLDLAGTNLAIQHQTVLAVLRPAHLQLAAVERPARQAVAMAEPTRRPMSSPESESRPTSRRLFQIAAIKYRSGEGLRSRTYRPAQPTKEATPRVPDHFANLLTAPVEIDVRIKVDRHGNVVTAQPISQTGSLRASSDDQIVLAHAVLDAARQWRFVPAELHSRPVPSEIILSFRFVARG